MKPNHSTLAADGETRYQLWYSPNTQSATKNKASPTPPDLNDVFDADEQRERSDLLPDLHAVGRRRSSIIVESLMSALQE